MKASELMIGNYVMAVNNYEDVFFVNCIYGYRDLNISCGIYKNYDTSIKNIKPIPLTEEWLLKFGFVINSVLCITCIDVLLYIEYKYNEITQTKVIYIDNKPLTHIRYVNQLQNLYFALTGEELKIKQ